MTQIMTNEHNTYPKNISRIHEPKTTTDYSNNRQSHVQKHPKNNTNMQPTNKTQTNYIGSHSHQRTPKQKTITNK